MAYDGPIPFVRETGQVLDYLSGSPPPKGNYYHGTAPDANSRWGGHSVSKADIEWRENKPFRAALRFRTFRRGRSAAHAIFDDEVTGLTYTMFLTDLEALLKSNGLLRDGVMNGEWVMCKRGANYGVQWVQP